MSLLGMCSQQRQRCGPVVRSRPLTGRAARRWQRAEDIHSMEVNSYEPTCTRDVPEPGSKAQRHGPKPERHRAGLRTTSSLKSASSSNHQDLQGLGSCTKTPTRHQSDQPTAPKFLHIWTYNNMTRGAGIHLTGNRASLMLNKSEGSTRQGLRSLMGSDRTDSSDVIVRGQAEPGDRCV